MVDDDDNDTDEVEDCEWIWSSCWWYDDDGCVWPSLVTLLLLLYGWKKWEECKCRLLSFDLYIENDPPLELVLNIVVDDIGEELDVDDDDDCGLNKLPFEDEKQENDDDAFNWVALGCCGVSADEKGLDVKDNR